jgi:RNA polymerase sigma-70 factor (subfamily 1)
VVNPAALQDDFLESHRSFLNLLVRVRLPPWLQRWVSPSDAVQQALTNAERHRAKLQEKSPAQVAAYLREVLKHVLADKAREHLPEKGNKFIDQLVESSTNLGLQLPADQTPPSEKVIREELLLDLSRALDQLPPRQRAAIQLRYLQVPRCSLAEIAGKLGCTEHAAGNLVFNALKKLRQVLRNSQ